MERRIAEYVHLSHSCPLWEFFVLFLVYCDLELSNSSNNSTIVLFSFTLHPAARQEEFTDQLARMSQSEAIFLLTTFANIATSRDGKECELIEAITTEVYKVWERLFHY